MSLGLWQWGFVVTAVTFFPFATLTLNPEFVFPYTSWFFPDESQGRFFGVMALFMVFSSALAAREVSYARVEVLVLAYAAAFALGAVVLWADMEVCEHVNATHQLLASFFTLSTVFWLYVAWTHADAPAAEGYLRPPELDSDDDHLPANHHPHVD